MFLSNSNPKRDIQNIPKALAGNPYFTNNSQRIFSFYQHFIKFSVFCEGLSDQPLAIASYSILGKFEGIKWTILKISRK